MRPTILSCILLGVLCQTHAQDGLEVPRATCKVSEATGNTTTGVVISSKKFQTRSGYWNTVLTNAHLIDLHGDRNRERYNIGHQGETYSAFRLGYYRGKRPDLAAFGFYSECQVAWAMLSERVPQRGDRIETCGYYKGSSKISCSAGEILNASDDTSIQADYSQESGQSGSPVYDVSGQIIGIGHSKDTWRQVPGRGIFVGLKSINRFLGLLERDGKLALPEEHRTQFGGPRGYTDRPSIIPNGGMQFRNNQLVGVAANVGRLNAGVGVGWSGGGRGGGGCAGGQWGSSPVVGRPQPQEQFIPRPPIQRQPIAQPIVQQPLPAQPMQWVPVQPQPQVQSDPVMVEVQGQRGPPGRDGAPGARGPAGAAGRIGQPGKDGSPGRPGRDGVDGRPGRDGTDAAVDYQTLAEQIAPLIPLDSGMQPSEVQAIVAQELQKMKPEVVDAIATELMPELNRDLPRKPVIVVNTQTGERKQLGILDLNTDEPFEFPWDPGEPTRIGVTEDDARRIAIAAAAAEGQKSQNAARIAARDTITRLVSYAEAKSPSTVRVPSDEEDLAARFRALVKAKRTFKVQPRNGKIALGGRGFGK